MDIQERKKSLETEILQLITQLEAAQQIYTDSQKKMEEAKNVLLQLIERHKITDVRYQEVCELLGLKAADEWDKMQGKQKESKKGDAKK